MILTWLSITGEDEEKFITSWKTARTFRNVPQSAVWRNVGIRPSAAHKTITRIWGCGEIFCVFYRAKTKKQHWMVETAGWHCFMTNTILWRIVGHGLGNSLKGHRQSQFTVFCSSTSVVTQLLFSSRKLCAPLFPSPAFSCWTMAGMVDRVARDTHPVFRYVVCSFNRALINHTLLQNVLSRWILVA